MFFLVFCCCAADMTFSPEPFNPPANASYICQFLWLIVGFDVHVTVLAADKLSCRHGAVWHFVVASAPAKPGQTVRTPAQLSQTVRFWAVFFG